MVLELIQFRYSRHLRGDSGVKRSNATPLLFLERVMRFGGTGTALVVLVPALSGAARLNPVRIARGMASVIRAIALAFFALVIC